MASLNESSDGATQRSDGMANSGVNGAEEWAPSFWANPRHVGLQFASAMELDAAIDWLWSAPALRNLPRVHVGHNTMIVPAEAVELFRQKGYHFTLRTVVSAGDLPAEEVNRIRAQRQ